MGKNKKENLKNTSLKITTIKLDEKTKQRLEHLREHKETYNEIINKVLNILNICLKNPMLANKILHDMERSRNLGSLVENPEKILRRKNNSASKQIPRVINNMQNNMRALRPSNNVRSINPNMQRNLNQKFPPRFQERRLE